MPLPNIKIFQTTYSKFCLDYFLISEKVMQKVKNSFIDMAYGSDHSMITLMINLNDTERGKSYWKHNSLLTDKEYLNIINKHIAAIKKQYAVPVYNSEQIENIPDSEIQFIISDQLFLEVLLMELHGQSISYASFKHKERNKVEQILIENIRSTENNLEKNKIENSENLKTQLNDIWQEKLKGHVIRSRAKHIDQGKNQQNTSVVWNSLTISLKQLVK